MTNRYYIRKAASDIANLYHKTCAGSLDVYEARRQSAQAIDVARGRIWHDMTQPPDTTAQAYLATLQGRDNLTRDEVAAAMSRYGDNSICRRAITEAAHRSAIYDFDGVSDPLDLLAALDDAADRALSPQRISESSPAAQKVTESLLRHAGDVTGSMRDLETAMRNA